MNKFIFHIDFNSYFATVEQQANPRLRGKPIGVTGGDRMKRTVLGAASVEAKRYGVKTGMQIWEAKRICPDIIIVPGDSDKYLSCTTKFLSIIKDYTPYVEVFSIDEAFLELSQPVIAQKTTKIGRDIKRRIKSEIGEWITCSIGISYNKLMAKLAGSLQKPDGLVVIPDQQTAIRVLDTVELDKICGIGPRIKNRLFNIGITNFKKLRQVPKECLLSSFKSYGAVLYNMARGIDNTPIVPFYEKEEVKSIGHRHTIDYDTDDEQEIKQILLKISEMVAKRSRDKKLIGKTIHVWFRYGLNYPSKPGLSGYFQTGFANTNHFEGDGAQTTINYTNDGLEIFKAAWKVLSALWGGTKIRMIGVSLSNLKPTTPNNLSWLPEEKRRQLIAQTMDKVNNKFGEFTLQRGILLTSPYMKRRPNPYLADRRFRL